MQTNAFSPGWAWMSSNTFSSVSNRVSPSCGSGTWIVFGTWFSFWSRWLRNRWPYTAGPRGWRARGVHVLRWLPGIDWSTNDRKRHGRRRETGADTPREEPPFEALPRSRARVAVARGDVALRGDQQVVLGVRAEPAGEPHRRQRLASAFWAPSAMGSLGAPIGGGATFSM